MIDAILSKISEFNQSRTASDTALETFLSLARTNNHNSLASAVNAIVQIVKQELDEHEEEIKSQESAISGLEHQLTSSCEEVDILTKKLDKSRQYNEEVCAENLSNDAELASSKERVDSLLNDCSMLRKNISEQMTLTNDANFLIKSLRDEIDRLRKAANLPPLIYPHADQFLGQVGEKI